MQTLTLNIAHQQKLKKTKQIILNKTSAKIPT